MQRAIRQRSAVTGRLVIAPFCCIETQSDSGSARSMPGDILNEVTGQLLPNEIGADKRSPENDDQ